MRITHLGGSLLADDVPLTYALIAKNSNDRARAEADTDVYTQCLERRNEPIPAHYRKGGIQMPEGSSPVSRRKRSWWRIFLGVVTTVAVVMLVMNPELAALGFLFDPVLLDVAIVFFGSQLLLFNSQVRTFLTATCSSVARRFEALRLRR